jgi:serine/threonine-protein phosphatase 2A regulatory subunit B
LVCDSTDKTIKLWKLFEKKIRSFNRNQSVVGGLAIPQVATRETVVAATPRRVFSNAHAYHINSISINSDGETYISADDLRINLWDLEISDQSFSTFLCAHQAT